MTPKGRDNNTDKSPPPTHNQPNNKLFFLREVIEKIEEAHRSNKIVTSNNKDFAIADSMP